MKLNKQTVEGCKRSKWFLAETLKMPVTEAENLYEDFVRNRMENLKRNPESMYAFLKYIKLSPAYRND